MKRLLALLLTGAMLSTGTAALAAEPETAPSGALAGTAAEITEVVTTTDEAGTASVLSLAVETAEGTPLILNVWTDTVCVDNQTGTPVELTQLAAGDAVYVYHDSAVTLSEPGQTNARVILTGLEDGASPAHLHTAGQVTRNTDGSIQILTDDGGMLVTVTGETPIRPLYTKNLVTAQDIRMGTRLLAWYDTVAFSYPGQTEAARVVLLPACDRDVAIQTQDGTGIGTGRIEDGVAMVPLRLTAETLGFTVTWDAETRSAHLENGDVQTDVCIGQDSYVRTPADDALLGMTAPQSYGAAPYIDAGGTTWAPAEVCALRLGGGTVRLGGDVLYV